MHNCSNFNHNDWQFFLSECPIKFDLTYEDEFEIGPFDHYVVFSPVSTTRASYQTLIGLYQKRKSSYQTLTGFNRFHIFPLNHTLEFKGYNQET